MAKVNLKTKTGMVVTVEGTKEEVAHIIQLIEEGVETPMGAPEKRFSSDTKAKPRKQSFNATDTILNLRESDYFNKPKTLTDVKRALEEQGQIFPLTTLSGIMLKQVRKRNFRRIKLNKNWSYVRGSN